MAHKAIYGGSFNPVHNGHIQIIEQLLKQTMIDEIILIPSRYHPFKGEIKAIRNSDRLNMLELVIAQYKKVSINYSEIKSTSVTYTVNTIKNIKKENAEDDFYLVMGSDNLQALHKWKDAKEIFNLVNILCFERPQFSITLNPSLAEFESSVKIVPAALNEVSSKLIKEKINNKEDVSSLIPEYINNYIIENRLYQR